DFSPAFDPDGKYLYFASQRTFDLPAFEFENFFPYAESNKLYAMTLRDSLTSPMAPQSDEEESDASAGAADAGGKKDDQAAGKPSKSAASTSAAWKIDLAGLSSRVTELAVPAGRYGSLHGAKGKLLYVALDAPDPDGNGPGKGTIRAYDLEKR